MFDEKRFKSAIVLSGMSMEQIANELGINVVTLYRKINRDGDFSRAEIQILKTLLPVEDPYEIFFTNKLA